MCNGKKAGVKGGDLRQFLLTQQQQQQENFSLLASSLGDTLTTLGNYSKQFLETIIRNLSRSPKSEVNRQNVQSKDPKGNRSANSNSDGSVHFQQTSDGADNTKNNIINNKPEDQNDGNRLQNKQLRLRTKITYC